VEMRNWLASADQPPFSGWSASEHLWGVNAKLRQIAELEAATGSSQQVQVSGPIPLMTNPIPRPNTNPKQ
jgi:hypothetical protein